ncbi:MAG: hypothetical protein ACRDL8_18905, partial [Solirubrobacteraceae bacterium]
MAEASTRRPGLISVGARAARAARRDGLASTARRAAGELRTRVALQERHTWYELSLAGLEAPELPDGVVLARLTDHDVDLLGGLRGAIAGDAARERLAGGAQAWAALRGRTPVFACWVFPERAPTIAARTGW